MPTRPMHSKVAQGRDDADLFCRDDFDDTGSRGRDVAFQDGHDDLDDKSAHLHDPHEVERLCTRHDVSKVSFRVMSKEQIMSTLTNQHALDIVLHSNRINENPKLVALLKNELAELIL